MDFNGDIRYSVSSVKQAGMSYANQTVLSDGISGANVSKMPLTMLKPGDLFGGQVTDIQANFIKLLLSNGQTLTAKLDPHAQGAMNLVIGRAAVFMVNENNNGQIVIKPYNNDQYPTGLLLKSLEVAGLNGSERNVNVVKTLMDNGMLIDRESLSKTVSLVAKFGEENLNNIVNLRKLGIPVTEESIAQLNNYNNLDHRMSADISNITNSITELLSNGTGVEKAQFNTLLLSALIPEDTADINNINVGNGLNSEMTVNSESTDTLSGINNLNTSDSNVTNATTITSLISGENSGNITEAEKLTNLLKAFEGHVAAAEEHETIAMKLNMTVEDTIIMGSEASAFEKLSIVNKYLKNDTMSDMNTVVENLTKDDDYKELVKDAIRERLLLEPEKFLQEQDKGEAVKKLYDNIRTFTETMIANLNKDNPDTSKLLQNVNNLNQNANFINDMSAMSSYVQLPINLGEETGHSELYVYNRKKGQQNDGGPITAFLHFDLDSLGATDINVKLDKSFLSVKFSLDKPDSVRLIEENIGQLVENLAKKGYEVTTQVEKLEAKKKAFEEAIEDQTTKVVVKRYSFDIRG